MGIFGRETKSFRMSRLNSIVALVFILSVCSVWSAPVSALGMGAATADSHIGEPLSVKIPIFNVKDPNNLSVILQRTDERASSMPLQAKVDYENFQLAIRVSSEKPTSEPYVSFVLEVVDGTDISSKSFTVLLDLDAVPQVSTLIANSESTTVVSAPKVTATNNVAVPLASASGSIMGPYDWAEAGRVPERFGPVLDGQSLWRVARRINRALGVSIDQAMWGLYENNRDQFATDSITSLRAGAILRIPSIEEASRLTERQAKEMIERASKANFSASSFTSEKPIQTAKSQVPEEPVIASEPAAEPVAKTQQQAVETAANFELTGLGEAGSVSGTPGGIDPQSQQIIASLAEAVGNLTEEVIKKDKKISFLEEKVAALEQYAQVNSADLVTAQSPVPQAGNSSIALQSPPQLQSQPSVASTVASPSWLSELSFGHYLMIGLLLVLLLVFAFRHRLMMLLESLHISGKSHEIEFDPTKFEHTESVQVFDSPVEIQEDMTVTVDANPVQQRVEPKVNSNGLSQRSILDAIKTAVQTDDPLSPQTLIDLGGEYSYTEMLSEASYSITETDLSFMERFERAMQQKDFGYANQLLNFARESELDLPFYHYHRLRLFEAMNDEDGFYDYYCEFEQMVPTYSTDLQTKISQLVLSMAQH